MRTCSASVRLIALKSAMFAVAVFLGAATDWVCAADAPPPAAAANVYVPPSVDEPFAKAVSLQRAADSLDAASLSWQKAHNCMTCHTNVPYLMVSPLFGNKGAAYPSVRSLAEKISTREEEPYKSVITAGLAFNDRAAGKLSSATAKRLDEMWKLQHDDGAWKSFKFSNPPLEDSDYTTVAFAALAAGAAPEKYSETEAAKVGLNKIRNYLAAHPAPNLHHKAILLWASYFVKNLIPEQEQKSCLDSLLALQRADGGWELTSLWTPPTGAVKTEGKSDGYATGLVVYLARQGGIAVADPRLQRGLEWLKTHQRESGRWFTPTLGGGDFISNAGTAFAILALNACGESTP